MIHKDRYTTLKSLLSRWRIQRGIESVLWALSFGILATAFIYVFDENPKFLRLIFSTTILVSLLAFFQHFRLWSTGQQEIIRYLNRTYPELEDSADLLLVSDDDLSGLAVVQKSRMTETLAKIHHQIRLPHRMGWAFLCLCFAGLAGAGVFYGKPYFTKEKIALAEQETIQNTSSISPSISKKTKLPELIIKKVRLQYTPPAYTRLPSETADSPNLKAPQFSQLKWTIQFSRSIKNGFIAFQNEEKIPLTQQSRTTYTAEMPLEKTGLYTITFTDKQGKTKVSDYYKLEAIPDVSPDIAIKGLEPYKEYFFDTLTTVSFTAKVKDDYGITAARMVATLSRGEGEAVKFRDDTLFFDQSFDGNRSYELSHTLRLRDLDMEPGDELYLHIEATDNRRPKKQTARTFKYIIAFEDTASINFSMEGTMALDRMPAYFRSQRQIIIDTEKLVAQKGKMSTTAFNETSNGIAADQKILRLRYGRFLGEEFETVIGEVSEERGETAVLREERGETAALREARSEKREEHEHDHKEEGHNPQLATHQHEEGILNTEHRITNDEGETHEHDNSQHATHQHEERISNTEHQITNSEGETKQPDNPQPATHQHDNTSTHQHNHDHGHDHEEGETENLLEAYMHIHDNMEEATFFDQSTAAKLRASLAKMWEAELQLRLYQPARALEHEYAALKLLKEVQQASRVYVERIGFEAPTIKVAEKRLTGELDDIKNTAIQKDNTPDDLYPAMREAVLVLEKLRQENRAPNHPEQHLLNDAGSELAGLALVRPGNYFVALQQLKLLTDGVVPKSALSLYLTAVQETFVQALPDTEYEPAPRHYTSERLAKLYLNFLK